VKNLPISTRKAADNVDIRRFRYLDGIDLAPVNSDEVRLLIGTDTPEAHIPIEVRSGDIDQPYAIRSRLGWAVRGPVTSDASPSSVNVNFQQSDVILQQQLERMWTTDFNDKSREHKEAMSVEDRRALTIMESAITKEDGRYKLALPWRSDDTCLPNNLPMAHARLSQLKRKLARDENLHRMYTSAVEDYMEKGYAEEVQLDTSMSTKI